MNSYVEMKERHQKETNAFPIKFAFTKEQFESGMRELGLDPSADTDKVVSIGGGGFIRKSDKQALVEMYARHEKERKEAIRADEDGTGFIYQMFLYELQNHEYAYTGDLDETLYALGYSLDEVLEDQALLAGFTKARKECFRQYDEMDEEEAYLRAEREGIQMY